MFHSHYAPIDPASVSWLARISRAVESFRRVTQTSRESFATDVAGHHHKLGNPTIGRSYQVGGDIFEMGRVNAQRLGRWMDEVTKDTGLMPVNALPAVLLALPMPERVALMCELLKDVGLQAAIRADNVQPATTHELATILTTVVREDAEANAATVSLLDGVNTKAELLAAQTELQQSITARSELLARVQSALTLASVKQATAPRKG